MVHAGKRPLKVFLCHASGDKPPVRDLYKRLTAEGVDAWLDKEKLLPGQDWRLEIPKAVKEADVVVVCLSNKSITKEGYVQKEIKFALDIAEEKPEGAIFLIPARLEDCIVPERLSRWEWVDIYEENGFVRLLRSLKLRADAVDATVEPDTYVDSDKETERKLEQLYTEGLAAFYTEEWEKACQRFQSILRERPNHKNAAEKLAEAERQRDLAKLYEQAMRAVRSEDWGTAIKTLDELSQKAEDYKDTAQLLRNAKKQKQLRELYAEARTLHAAQKWQAVVKVFEQITAIDSAYPDADGLLSSTQKEVAELKRLADLNDRYSHALREMELGSWYEAGRLLESVHKSQTGFLETEKLLRKVESEIEREEKKHRQNDEINTLYEQAHGLLRSKKWQNALEKLELIRKLDDHFPDSDGIADKAQKELAREEQETERQNKLAALYAEAVKLLKEEKYQEALDKWQEVRAIDPKYPDRQWVGRTLKRRQSGAAPAKVEIQSQVWMQKIRIEWFILLAALGFGLARLIEQYLGMLFHIPVSPELGWSLRGVLHGLIMALILRHVEKDWKWQAFLVFAICWAIVYPMSRMVTLKLSTPFLFNVLYSLAPALSLIISSKWIERKTHWSIYILIFAGWLLAWMIGQSVANFLFPIFNGASSQWIICDIVVGAIGLWITVDLIKSKSGENPLGDESCIRTQSASDTKKLLLLAFLSVVVLRAIVGVLKVFFKVQETAPVPTTGQVIYLFVLGGVYSTVVALALKKVVPNWKIHHSLTVIIGWMLGLGTFSLLWQFGLDGIIIVMALCGLSIAAAIKWARTSLSPLKVTLIFICWALAWKYGSMLGIYLVEFFKTDYAWCVADAVTILLGLCGTFSVLDGNVKRLAKLSLLAALGFGAGNLIATLLIRQPPAWGVLPLLVWGFVGGFIFASPSRDWKRMLVMGGLCALGFLLGDLVVVRLMPYYGDAHNIFWGLALGMALGLPTRRVSVIALLAILGSAIFTITPLLPSGANLGELWASTLRGALIGLVLGLGYAYITKDTETIG